VTKYAQGILNRFLEAELSYEDAQQAIIYFISNENIRCGDYTGNEFVLKKLSLHRFAIHSEFIDAKEQIIDIYNIAVYSKDELLNAIVSMLGQPIDEPRFIPRRPTCEDGGTVSVNPK
jgi:hypothetical protein